MMEWLKGRAPHEKPLTEMNREELLAKRERLTKAVDVWKATTEGKPNEEEGIRKVAMELEKVNQLLANE